MAKKKNTSMTKWDEKLAAEAEVEAKIEATSGGGQFFSMKSGQLSWDGATIPGNEMAVVILHSIHANIHYAGKYNAAKPQGPACFAFGRNEADLVPHDSVVDAGQNIHVSCEGCSMNEWGSAAEGRGKGCKNTRRLGMIPAGLFDSQGRFKMSDDLEDAGVGYLQLPVTSVKAYAGFVQQVANTLKRPLWGIITKVKVVPDPKSQFKVQFEAVEAIGDDWMEVVSKRHEEVQAVIDFPYEVGEEEDAPKSKKRASKNKAPAKKAPAKRSPNGRRKRGGKY